MYDLTHDKGAGRNFLCEKCGAHYYHPIKSFLANQYHDARWFTKIEWDKYVNTPNEEDPIASKKLFTG